MPFKQEGEAEKPQIALSDYKITAIQDGLRSRLNPQLSQEAQKAASRKDRNGQDLAAIAATDFIIRTPKGFEFDINGFRSFLQDQVRLNRMTEKEREEIDRVYSQKGGAYIAKLSAAINTADEAGVAKANGQNVAAREKLAQSASIAKPLGEEAEKATQRTYISSYARTKSISERDAYTKDGGGLLRDISVAGFSSASLVSTAKYLDGIYGTSFAKQFAPPMRMPVAFTQAPLTNRLAAIGAFLDDLLAQKEKNKRAKLEQEKEEEAKKDTGKKEKGGEEETKKQEEERTETKISKAEREALESSIYANASKIKDLEKTLEKDGSSLEKRFNDQKVQDFFEARMDDALRPIARSGAVNPEEVKSVINPKVSLGISKYDPRIQAAMVVAYRQTVEYAVSSAPGAG